MANWGLLMGVGQGIQQVGGMLESRNKAQLADKLSQEKEVRDEARVERQRQRQLLEPDPDNITYEPTDNGAWMKVRHNRSGGVFEKTLANPEEMRQQEMARQKDQLNIDNLAAEAALKGKELESFDQDKSLEARLTEARIGQAEQSGMASMIRARNSGRSGSKDIATPKPTPAQVADSLLERNAAVIEELGIDATMARDIANQVALELINRSKAGEPKDPGDTFLKALQLLKQRGIGTRGGLEAAAKARVAGNK